MTWFVSESGFALTLFVAETTPLDTSTIREAAHRYGSVFDELMPRYSPRPDEPARRGSVWWSGGAVIELDLIDSHERIGLVQVHVEDPDPKGAREPSAG